MRARSRPRRCSGSGSVAMISEYTGHRAATMTGQCRRVALRRADDRPAPGPLPLRVRTRPGSIAVDRCLLVAWCTPRRSTASREPAHQPAGMDRRAVGGVRRAERRPSPGARPAASLAVEQPQVVLVPVPGACVVDLLLGPCPLRCGCGPARSCRPWPGGRRCPRSAQTRATSSTVARIAACWAQRRARGPTIAANVGQRGREQRRAPAAVAAGRAEAGDVLSPAPRSAGSGRPRPGSRPSRAR